MEIRIIESTDIATVLHMAGVLQSDSPLHSEARMAAGFPGDGYPPNARAEIRPYMTGNELWNLIESDN